ncbi:copper amine oxidase N-terminal domain-containing protein [Tumebacillus lipolyticus]|uniref:Copper amine oxidase N-terminal domain-containing protein n=1 Tax=Tumebacillus lipolyticus TaxID=1280370 RepID=A0ABW4ZWL5_9BACL
MSNIWKKIGFFTLIYLTFLIIMGDGTAQAGTNERPDVYVDGEKLPFDVQPLNKGGTVLVPMRTIFESVGADVTWEAATQTAVGKKDGVVVRLTIGKEVATVGSRTVALGAPAQLIGGRTMVPARFVGESFGNDVKWDGQGKVTIKTQGAPTVRVIGSDSALREGQVSALKAEIDRLGIMQHVAQNTGVSFELPVWIYLSNSDEGYRKTILEKMNATGWEADQLVDWSNGLSYGNRIALPLYKLSSARERVSTITHELVHSAFSQHRMPIPNWINEGMAWQIGLDIGYQGAPSVLRSSMDGQCRAEVLGAMAEGDYVPLILDNNAKFEALNDAPYNLEYQDYLAVRSLIGQFGKDKLIAYLNRAKQGGDRAQLFEQAFALSLSEFEHRFSGALQKELNLQNQGVELTLRVTGEHAGTFALLGQDAKGWSKFRLSAGEHTLRIFKDGRIEGVKIEETIPEEYPMEEVVFLTFEPNIPVQEEDMVVVYGGVTLLDAFGEYSLLGMWKTDLDADSHFLEDNRMLGIEVVSVKTIR